MLAAGVGLCLRQGEGHPDQPSRGQLVHHVSEQVPPDVLRLVASGGDAEELRCRMGLEGSCV